MNDEIVSLISIILERWNPLGDKAATTKKLDGYKYEAMDILSTIKITKVPVEKAVLQVLTQAFDISLNKSELEKYSAEIERLLRVQ
jgi:hypothetical protein